MRNNLVFPFIFAFVLSVACSKSETAVRKGDDAQPSSVTSQATTDQPAAEGSTSPPSDDEISTAASEPSTSPSSDEPTSSAVPRQTTTAEPSASTSQPPTQSPPAHEPEPVKTMEPEPSTPVEPPREAPVASTPAEAESTAPTTRASSGRAPKTHKVDHSGIMHAPGAESAAQKCSTCHGKDLTGGKVAKISCFECHEKNWN